MRSSTKQRAIRHRRVRKKVAGSPQRPRLAVFRSNKHVYAQVIDDLSGTTLASASTLDSDAKAESPGEAAGKVGKLVASRAKEKGIEAVVFDRGGFKFHGVVKAVAEGAREEGLKL